MLENRPPRSVLIRVHIVMLAKAATIPPVHNRVLEDVCPTVQRAVQLALEPVGILE